VTKSKLGEATHFTGAVDPNAIPDWLRQMDVCVAPYPQLEEFYFSPLKVYEYMAAARPVVASAVGQLKQLIEHEVDGLLVPPGDGAALALALVRLREDGELRKRLGETAREKVLRDYTWDGVAQKILKLGQRKADPALVGSSRL
jgi:glycosyltransferase involved in cell wall biosynthesis